MENRNLCKIHTKPVELYCPICDPGEEKDLKCSICMSEHNKIDHNMANPHADDFIRRRLEAVANRIVEKQKEHENTLLDHAKKAEDVLGEKEQGRRESEDKLSRVKAFYVTQDRASRQFNEKLVQSYELMKREIAKCEYRLKESKNNQKDMTEKVKRLLGTQHYQEAMEETRKMLIATEFSDGDFIKEWTRAKTLIQQYKEKLKDCNQVLVPQDYYRELERAKDERDRFAGIMAYIYIHRSSGGPESPMGHIHEESR